MSPMEALRPRRALIVEGNTVLRLLLRMSVDDLGFTALDVGDGAEGLRHVTAGRFDVVLLGVATPGLDGFSLCRAIRQRGPNVHTPLLLLGTGDRDAEVVQGLESGADDVVSPPFRGAEVRARVTAMMRRLGQVPAGATRPAQIPLTAHLLLDPQARAVLAPGRVIPLTPRECAVLRLLASRRDEVVTRTQLQREVWGDELSDANRVVDLLVSRLRRKLEPHPRRPRLIHTAWGIGYRLSSSE